MGHVTPGSLAGPQSICLSMIVRNEASVIRRCLDSVRPFVEAWAIVDTGSTDGTQDIIRAHMADIPGQLIERPWVDDFSHSRNQALDLARETGADYAFTIDADDVIEPTTPAHPPLPPLLGRPLMLPDLHVTGAVIDRVRVFPVSFRWLGLVHESLRGPAKTVLQLSEYRVRMGVDGAAARAHGANGKIRYYANLLRQQIAATDRPNWLWFFSLGGHLEILERFDEALEAYLSADRIIPAELPEVRHSCTVAIAQLRSRAAATPTPLDVSSGVGT